MNLQKRGCFIGTGASLAIWTIEELRIQKARTICVDIAA